MRRATCVTWWKKASIVVAVSALVLCGASAFAQGGGGGGGQARLTPEQVAKATELEARTVGQILGLNDEQTTKLVDAYKASRQNIMTAMRDQAAGGGRPGMEAMMKVQQEERGKLETTLKAFLNPEQTSKALGYLGGLNRRWDSFVLALDGMNLDAEKKAKAMALTAEYAAESNKLRESAAGGGDVQAMREKSRELKTKLDTDLGGILSAEQMVKWNEATAMRGGQGRQGRSGRPESPKRAAPAPATPAPAAPAAPAPAK